MIEGLGFPGRANAQVGEEGLAAALKSGECFGALTKFGVVGHEAAIEAFRNRFDFDDPVVALDGGRPVATLFEKIA